MVGKPEAKLHYTITSNMLHRKSFLNNKIDYFVFQRFLKLEQSCPTILAFLKLKSFFKESNIRVEHAISLDGLWGDST